MTMIRRISCKRWGIVLHYERPGSNLAGLSVNSGSRQPGDNTCWRGLCKYAFDYLGEKDYSLTLSCESFESESALTEYLDDTGFQLELELNQNEFIYMSQSDRNNFCYFDSRDQTEGRCLLSKQR